MGASPYNSEYRHRSAVLDCGIFARTETPQTQAHMSDLKDWARSTNFKMPDGSIELKEGSREALDNF